MLEEIRVENKRVYLVISDTSYFKPEMIESYYATKVDYSIVPEDVKLEKWNNTYIFKLYGRIIPLHQDNFPAFTKTIQIKPPRKNGYKWKNGGWQKI